MPFRVSCPSPEKVIVPLLTATAGTATATFSAVRVCVWPPLQLLTLPVKIA